MSLENIDLNLEYVTAAGPQGLMQVLDDFLNKSNNDPIFARTPHYILYQFGSQRSLIKVDMSEHPFQFWYSDFDGRPATEGVKETIATFLSDKCGEKNLFLPDDQSEEASL